MRVLIAMGLGVLLFLPAAPATAASSAPASTIALTPAAGAPGQSVAVTGTGWSPAFGRVSVWLDPGTPAPPVLLASATVDGRGNVNGTGIVPRLGVGAHRVAACQACIDGVEAERGCASGVRASDTSCATLLVVFLATRSVPASGPAGTGAVSVPSVGVPATSIALTDATSAVSPSWRPALTASALAVGVAAVVLLLGLFVLRRRPASMPSVRVERVDGGDPGPEDPTGLAGVIDVPRAELEAALEPVIANSADPTPSNANRRSLGRELADNMDVLLQRDLVSICTLGWRASAVVREAGLDSLRRPGRTQLVELAEQSMSRLQTVGFDLIVGETRIANVTLAIRCDVALRDVAVAVTDGAITAVEFGAGTVTVSIRDAADDVLLERSRAVSDAQDLGLPRRISLVEQVDDHVGPLGHGAAADHRPAG